MFRLRQCSNNLLCIWLFTIHTDLGDGLRTSSLQSLPNRSCASAHRGRAHISPICNLHALNRMLPTNKAPDIMPLIHTHPVLSIGITRRSPTQPHQPRYIPANGLPSGRKSIQPGVHFVFPLNRSCACFLKSFRFSTGTNFRFVPFSVALASCSSSCLWITSLILVSHL